MRLSQSPSKHGIAASARKKSARMKSSQKVGDSGRRLRSGHSTCNSVKMQTSSRDPMENEKDENDEENPMVAANMEGEV